MNAVAPGLGGVAQATERGTFLEVLGVFLKLGLTSFGGPIAHLGYFRAEFVERRRWLTESNFVDLVALAQFLPGPASSQTGFAIGLMRAGYAGGLAAWLGFTLPSAFLLLLFAFGAGSLADTSWGVGLLHGLKLVAVAIVAQAVLGMAKSLCPDRERASIAVAGMIAFLLVGGSLGQVSAILLGGIAGMIVCRGGTAHDGAARAADFSRGWDGMSRGLLCASGLGVHSGRAHAAWPFRRVLSIGRSGLWRRACRSAAFQGCGRRSRLDFGQFVPRRLWRSSGGTGTALYVRGIPRRGGERAARRRCAARRSPWSRSFCRGF